MTANIHQPEQGLEIIPPAQRGSRQIRHYWHYQEDSG